MESIEKLGARIKTWRTEYVVFGKLSGETLQQMDQAARALSGEARRQAAETNSGPAIHTGDDDALDVLSAAMTTIDEMSFEDAEITPAEFTDLESELAKLMPVLEDLHRATRAED